MDSRLAIRRKPHFRDEERALLHVLNNLEGVCLDAVTIIHIYDVIGASGDGADIAALLAAVVRDERVDDEVSAAELQDLLDSQAYLGVEPLPGQYDQRADAAEQALRLLRPHSTARIFSAELYVFSPAPSADALQAIRNYLINPVESGEKDFSILRAPNMGERAPLKEYPDFLELDRQGLSALLAERSMAMNLDDLALIQEYFRSEKRVPTEVELAVLDTYWSDHCRHTTFNTELTDIEIEPQPLEPQMRKALARWEELREANGRTHKPHTLMELGTIMGRELRRTGKLTSQEVSEEINACSVRVNVTPLTCSNAAAGGDGAGVREREAASSGGSVAVETSSRGDGAATCAHGEGVASSASEPWLLMFKNETHNHPTEIEPFGGAATCLGGAIRDPLSGRSWVYQALRLSGAGDITAPRCETLEGKLPQADISSRATLGYSSYGNQIGLATTHVREFVHPGYVAKRMELGAVVAAAPEENVKRLEPQAGDLVIILGGRTGRDGIGGATGSSKAHNEESLAVSGAEVQKGNPVNERKIQRLFRRAEVSRMIVRCNDFGAGGVCVSVGELADGLDIHLDRVPLKYAGLNAREIAISESQERMAVVVRAGDAPAFMAAAEEENLEATVLAEVTDTGRMRMFDGDELVLDLSREFIDTNGASRQQAVRVAAPALSSEADAAASGLSVLESLALAKNCSQEGMVEQFDATVGRSTVLMPYGGILQKTAETASIQTLPVSGGTHTASIMTYGYSPELADHSPYMMGAYSVVEALSRLVAAGGDARGAWLTVQEYFQRPDHNEKVWGDVLQALLGLLEAQDAFEVAAIGGKDSMSGTFGSGENEIHVPPTLVSFAVAAMDARNAISATLPYKQLDLYYLPHTPLPNGMPNYEQLRQNFDTFTHLAHAGAIVAASPVLQGGLGTTLVNMCVGNEVGFFASSTSARQYLTPGSEAQQLASAPLGGIVFAVDPTISVTPFFTIGAEPCAAPSQSRVNGSESGEARSELSGAKPQVIYLGATTDKNHDIDLGFEKFSVREALDQLESRYAQVYPLNASTLGMEDFSGAADSSGARIGVTASPCGSGTLANPETYDEHRGPHFERAEACPPLPSDKPHVLLPVFPGTNSEYDMAEAFQAAGASTEFLVLRNLTSDMLQADTDTFIAKLRDPATKILAFSGGFSLGDEPDGSAKFMAAFLAAPAVAEAIKAFTARDGLVLGICNGFQALVKSGFLPYGDPDKQSETSPTLAHNRQLRHVSRIATTRVATQAQRSPWLSSFTQGQIHKIPVSHGEGRFVVSEAEARALFEAGQVAFQYVDASGQPTMEAPENPNGSSYAIEGIISPDGKILGKMGHPERYRPGLMLNIPDIAQQSIFANAVNYCRERAAS